MSTDHLTNYALITGGSNGIGYELAKLFAADGINLILVARTKETLEQRAKELRSSYGIKVITIAKDLFKPNAAFELYDEVKKQGLIVDALVNDAGQGQFGLVAESDIHRLLDIVQLNIGSLTVLTYLFLQDMLQRRNGKILQLGSIASEMPGPWQAVYHATKAYVLSLSEALYTETKDTGVTVTTLQPGATDTDFFNKANMQDSKILDSKLSDPAKVAKDGYQAMLNGEDKIVSGFKNKMMIGMSNVMPEQAVSERMNQMQKPKGNS
jgi:short-subunit dehydrogenase